MLVYRRVPIVSVSYLPYHQNMMNSLLLLIDDHLLSQDLALKIQLGLLKCATRKPWIGWHKLQNHGLFTLKITKKY